MRTLILCLSLIVSVSGKSLTRNSHYEDFEQICEEGSSVNGLSARLTKTWEEEGVDFRLLVICRQIDPEGNFEVGECRDADEFQLFTMDGEIGENRIGSPSNCAQGEYLAGIKSTYGDDGRTFQYHCCAAGNAQVDTDIGCHHVQPIDPFGGDVKGKLLLKNDVVPTKECPRDALSGMEITPNGMALKFCPYKIDGVEYDEECATIKEDIDTFTECDGISEDSEFEECSTGDDGDGDGDGDGDDTGGDYGDGSCSDPTIQDSMILVGHVVEVQDAASIAECVQLCSAAEDDFGFTCLSGMFYPDEPDQNCLLNSETATDNPDIFVEDDSIPMSYFEC